jgi:hypothetical protein
MISVLVGISSACGADDQSFVQAPRPLDRVASSPQTLATLAGLRNRPVRPVAYVGGGGCPTTTARTLQPVVSGGKAPRFGYGSGPVYLSGINKFYAGGFDNQIWLIEPSYAGPILIRGREIIGARMIALEEPVAYAGSGLSQAGSQPPEGPIASLNIGGASVPFYSELDLPPSTTEASAADWRMFFTRTHIEQPGCYELQVDGSTFSSVVVIDVAAADRPKG